MHWWCALRNLINYHLVYNESDTIKVNGRRWRETLRLKRSTKSFSAIWAWWVCDILYFVVEYGNRTVANGAWEKYEKRLTNSFQVSLSTSSFMCTRKQFTMNRQSCKHFSLKKTCMQLTWLQSIIYIIINLIAAWWAYWGSFFVS